MKVFRKIDEAMACLQKSEDDLRARQETVSIEMDELATREAELSVEFDKFSRQGLTNEAEAMVSHLESVTRRQAIKKCEIEGILEQLNQGCPEAVYAAVETYHEALPKIEAAHTKNLDELERLREQIEVSAQKCRELLRGLHSRVRLLHRAMDKSGMDPSSLQQIGRGLNPERFQPKLGEAIRPQVDPPARKYHGRFLSHPELKIVYGRSLDADSDREQHHCDPMGFPSSKVEMPFVGRTDKGDPFDAAKGHWK